MAIEKFNLKISKLPAYQEWKKSLFEPNDDRVNVGEEIESALDNLKQKENLKALEWLKRHVFVTCFCAKNFNPWRDNSRTIQADGVKNLNSQLKTVSKLIKLAEKDRDFGVRFLFSCIPFNSPEEIVFNIPRGKHDAIFRGVLEDYQKSLQWEIDDSKNRLKKLLVVRGGLYCTRTKPDGTEFRLRGILRNSFFFHLTFIFRHFTDRKFNLGVYSTKMPRFGKPRYNITQEINDALFPDDGSDQTAILKMVEQLESGNVLIHPWKAIT